MEFIIKIDEKNNQAKALFQYLKTLPFIELKKGDKDILAEKEKEILQISKSINKNGAKKWFAKKGITV